MTRRGVVNGTASGALAPALALSAALHAALLAGLPEVWIRSTPAASPPLVAWLVPGGPPVTVPDPAAIEPPARPAAASPRRRDPEPPRTAPRAAAAEPVQRRIPVPRAAPPIPATPSPERAASAPMRAAAAREATVAAPPSVALTGPATPAPAADPVAKSAGGAAAPAAAPGQPLPDLDPLAQYRLALIGAAKRHKRYPPRAIDLGWEGRVDVRLMVDADGRLARVLIERSSGHDLLDARALELLRTASALTPVPPALRDRAFAVEVPVLYELKDAR